MSTFLCPFCNVTMAVNSNSYNKVIASSSRSQHFSYFEPTGNYSFNKDSILIKFYECPSCHKVSIIIEGKGSQFDNNYSKLFFPNSLAKQFPDYVPKQILADYNEAYQILELSPKSSATLSRRCIQGMIRDVWKVKAKSLYSEIDAIKDKIDANLWSSINALRQLGNIGAHMEEDINLIIDIDPTEAKKLLTLVEILIKEWYINPHERNLLFDEIIDINKDKQVQRSKKD